MLNDLRFAFRMVLKHRLFSLTVIVTMALGIGVNTTVFTLVNSVLYKPVPIPNGERLVSLRGHNLTNADSEFGISYVDYRDFKKQNQSFDRMEALRYGSATLSETTNPPERYNAATVTTGLFDMLETFPSIGRGFLPEDGEAGAPKVFLISDTVWRSRYGGDPGVIGRQVRLNGHPATLIGVMPQEFQFPTDQKVWMPLITASEEENRKNRSLDVFAMRKGEVEMEAARADLATIAHRIASDYPDDNKDISVLSLSFHERYNGGEIRLIFFVMLGAVGFVLLIACANVANMMLSRAISRRHEISVRTSLGAGRWQLVRQLLIESVLLSVLGGLLGMVIAQYGIYSFDQATQNVGKPYWIIFEMDYSVFVYFAAICVMSGIVFGLTPALRATRVDTATVLKDSGKGTSGHRGGKLAAVLVVFQFALTAILLSGAGLMVRSFAVTRSINDFLPHDEVFTVRINLPGGEGELYEEEHARLNFYDSLYEKVGQLPGVTGVAATSNPPGLGDIRRRIEIEGQPVVNENEAAQATFVVQSNDYLNTIGLPILRGEGFDDFVLEDGVKVAVATRDFADRFWPEESALGKRFRFFENNEWGPWITVQGIAADIDQDPTELLPLVFLPHSQKPWGGLALVVRSSSDAAGLAGPVRRVVQEMDRDLPLFEALTLTQAIERRFWYFNVFGSLFLSFALIGLVIASVGIYGVIAQVTAQRTQEIGIRMALGASAGRVLRLFLSLGMIQLGVGLTLGLIASAGTNGLMSALVLEQISPRDPIVFVSITLVIGVVGMVACMIPSFKASQLAPATALRTD